MKDDPANAGLRSFLEKALHASGPTLSPAAVRDPYYTLGTHPDLVARLWDELGKGLPKGCRVVFSGRPALMRPESGIVFAFATGTHIYALRLPAELRAEALESGAKRTMDLPTEPSLDLSEAGDEWVFCGWLAGEEDWCRVAYDQAGMPR